MLSVGDLNLVFAVSDEEVDSYSRVRTLPFRSEGGGVLVLKIRRNGVVWCHRPRTGINIP